MFKLMKYQRRRLDLLILPMLDIHPSRRGERRAKDREARQNRIRQMRSFTRGRQLTADVSNYVNVSVTFLLGPGHTPFFNVAFPDKPPGRHVELVISELYTRPTCASVNASPRTLRPRHETRAQVARFRPSPYDSHSLLMRSVPAASDLPASRLHYAPWTDSRVGLPSRPPNQRR